MATPIRMPLRWIASLAPLLLSAACGGNEPPPAAPTAPTASAAPPAPAPPDVSAVPDPAGLVFSLRVNKASAVLGATHTWTNLPMPGSEQVSEMLTGEAVGPVVDLDQPIDVAVAVEGLGPGMKPLVAVSAAVKDPDKVKANFADRYKLTPGEGGATIVGGLGAKPHADDDKSDDTSDDSKDDSKGSDDDDANPRMCELAPAFGAAPVRIVCGFSMGGFASSSKAMKLLAPWLARSATRATTTTDLHADLRMAPLEPTIQGAKPLIGTLLGAALRQAPGGQVLGDVAKSAATDLADFLTDLDGVAIDGTAADTGAQMSFTLHLTGSSSTVGKMLTAHPERNGPPPATFWQLPADADSGSFSRGMDETLLAGFRQTILDAVGGGLVDVGFKTADAKALQAAVAKIPLGQGGVYAAGLDATALRQAIAASKALGKDDKSPKKREARRAVAEALLGWRVMEVDQPSTAFVPAIRDLAAAVVRPGVAASVHTLDKDITMPRVSTPPVPAGEGLAKGALQWVVEVTPPASHVELKVDGKVQPHRPPPLPTRLHVFVVPDGARTWLGIGEEKAVAARIAASMASGGTNLGSRADLASFKDAKDGSAGFVSARSLMMSDLQRRALLTGSSHGAASMLDEVDRLPNKGQSAILFSLSPQAGGPPAAVVMALSVPRGTMEDAATEFVRHVHISDEDDDD